MTRHLVKWWRNSQLGHTNSSSRRRALIVLRQSPNWEDGTSILEAAETYDRLIGRPIGFARGFIELWNKTFATTYFQVRQNLKEITLANFMAVKGADCVQLNELQQKPEIAADIILFSDDDDWFSPVIVKELEGVPAEIGGVTWPSVRYDGAFQLRKDVFCYTNNYAVLAPAQQEPSWVGLYAQHGGAEACFHQRGIVKTTQIEFVAERHEQASSIDCDHRKNARENTGKGWSGSARRRLCVSGEGEQTGSGTALV